MVFDQYQRYKTAQIIINEIKKNLGLSKLRILEVGSSNLKNLEYFLPEDDIFQSDIEPLKNGNKQKNFFVADATNMPEIADNTFDLVIAMDVYEHIPNSKREFFLNEINRVASIGVLLCFPYFSIQNQGAEKRANQFYQLMYGKSHRWLSEHLENGLPTIDELKNYLTMNNYNYELFYHGDIFLWEELIKVLFYSYLENNIEAYRNELDEIYKDFIYYHDVSQYTYRVFLFFSLDKQLIYKITEFLSETFTETDDFIYKNLLQQNIKEMYTACQVPKAWINWSKENISIYDENLKVAIKQRDDLEKKVLEYDINLKKALQQKSELLSELKTLQDKVKKWKDHNRLLEENLKKYDRNLKLSIEKNKQLEKKVEEYDENLKIAISNKQNLEKELQTYDMNLKLALIQKQELKEKLLEYDKTLKIALEANIKTKED